MPQSQFRFTMYIILIMLLALFSVLIYQSYALFYTPMINKSSYSDVIEIKKNSPASDLVKTMRGKGLIHHPSFFLFTLKLLGLSEQVKAGVYDVTPGESAIDFLYRVAEGDVIKKSFTIIEGSTIWQVSKKLASADYLSYKSDAWKVIQGKHHSAEGMLLADTYIYHAGSDGKDILKQGHEKLQEYLIQRWMNRASNLPYRSPYEMLIVASIIEKEASRIEEKKLIAGVIVNRLRKNMRLQVDPTVIYSLGENYHGKLTRKDLKNDSPYNTYKYRGLPPTPIAMVGKEAIDAAADPILSNYLYFVAKGDGTHHFSSNYEQQKAAIKKYLKGS